jgi:thiol-disulfide isomerase/thioredoxin
MRFFNFVFLIIFIFIYSTFGQDKQPPPPPPGGEFPTGHGISKNSKAPDFKYQSLNNEDIQLSNYRGRYVIIDFWGTWCEPCRKETPFLKNTYLKYRNKLMFIGISVNDNKASVIDYIEKKDIEWPQIFVPFDSKDSIDIIGKYNVQAYASLFLIDPNGDVILGAQTQEDVDKLKGDKLIETLAKVLN